MKNQKYEKPEDAVDETDVLRGKSPADVDFDIEDPEWEERVELEMATGDSRKRDEDVVGEKSNIGGKAGDPYIISPLGEKRDETNAGEKEVEKRKARAKHRKEEQFYPKEEQPVNETLDRMKSLLTFKFRDNTDRKKV